MLVVDSYGVFVGKKGDRIVVRRRGEKVCEEPAGSVDLIRLSCRGVCVSLDLLELVLRYGIDLVVASRSGVPLALLVPFRAGSSIRTRREQYWAYRDDRGAFLAKAFIEGKVRNQANFLKYIVRVYRSVGPDVKASLLEASERISGLVEDLRGIECRDCDYVRRGVLGVEAEAASIYWEALSRVVPRELGFSRRRKRSERPRDVFNVLLNYAYGVLATEVWIALVKAGLDPWAGFLHKDNPRRPGLVYDLMEEFRVPVVDKPLLGFVVERRGLVSGFLGEDGRLCREGRLEVCGLLNRVLGCERRFGSERLSLRSIILRQARRIVKFLHGRRLYRPYVERW
ncbi:MAG: CRISPR-associated endonuclease Cas1 [Thermoprotei archaeon]|nr:MAG: CRISPR-associated endonuclease Cas1 [Thermoprotei archaeon]